MNKHVHMLIAHADQHHRLLSLSALPEVVGSSGVALQRDTLADVMDAFLFVQQQAEQLPPDDASTRAIQQQCGEWVAQLRRSIHGALSAAGTGTPAAASTASTALTLAVPRTLAAVRGPTNSSAPAPLGFGFGFGGSSGSALSLAPFGSGTAVSSRPAAVSATLAPAFSFGPAASPFANDHSAAANSTPAKTSFGLSASTPAAVQPSSTGFGSELGGRTRAFGPAAATPLFALRA